MRQKLPGLPPPDVERARRSVQELQTLSAPLPPGAGSLSGQAQLPVHLIQFSLPLECITPVVGGGVESREPDALEALRISGIRGQLRMWWRALQSYEASEGLTASQVLFGKEEKLWGGVSRDEEGPEAAHNKKGGASRSRVNLRVKVVSAGQLIPAGRYEGGRGQYRALPKWDGGPAMGYGLFPLQYERNELRQLTLADPPTRNVRHGLKFNLLLTLALLGTEVDAVKMAKEVLASLWTWIHFGGIGARSTRGFGALALRRDAKEATEDVQIDYLSPVRGADSASVPQPSVPQPAVSGVKAELEQLKSLFQEPGARGLQAWLRDAQTSFGWPYQVVPQGEQRHLANGSHPRLPARAIAHGQPKTNAKDALIEGLDLLKQFRQGPGVGRTPGNPRPGRSYWPEPDTLRRIARIHREARFGPHEPASGNSQHNGAPRAAFGMPLNITFKDSQDTVANGAIVPALQGRRWTSPLRMRPLRCKDGYVCWMLYLHQPFPRSPEPRAPERNTPALDARQQSPETPQVAAVLTRTNQPQRFEETEAGVPILNGDGARAPVQDLLKKANNDAVLAFLFWAQKTRQFQRVEGT